MNLPLLKIVEALASNLPDDEGKTFIAAVNVAAEGKDLSVVHWQLWDAELQALPKLLPKYIKTLINEVIAGMKLRADGQDWPEAAKVIKAVYAAVEALADAASAACVTNKADVSYAAAKSYAIYAAYAAAYADSPNAAAYAAAFVTDYTTLSATSYADFSATLAFEVTDIHSRQRDTLFSLIENAPSVKDTEKGTAE